MRNRLNKLLHKGISSLFLLAKSAKIAKIKLMKEKNTALRLAMKLIGLRRRSVFEIENKLLEKKYGDDLIHKVIEELKKYKYLDDETFAECYINDRINLRPCGPKLIRKELCEKHVPPDIINAKLETLLDNNIEMELADKIVSKKLKLMSVANDKRKIRQKLSNHLYSKGFSFDVISQTLENKLK